MARETRLAPSLLLLSSMSQMIQASTAGAAVIRMATANQMIANSMRNILDERSNRTLSQKRGNARKNGVPRSVNAQSEFVLVNGAATTSQGETPEAKGAKTMAIARAEIPAARDRSQRGIGFATAGGAYSSRWASGTLAC